MKLFIIGHGGRAAEQLVASPRGCRPQTVADVAAIAGHADGRVTASVCSRPSEEDMRRALDRIAGEEEGEE